MPQAGFEPAIQNGKWLTQRKYFDQHNFVLVAVVV
jgi:hypothetical protein